PPYSRDGFDRLAGGEDGGMDLANAAITLVVGEQVKQQGVVETEAANQHVGAGHLEHLTRGQTFQNVGNLGADAEAEDGAFAIRAHHVLSQHQVGKIDFLYVVVGVSRVHHALLD